MTRLPITHDVPCSPASVVFGELAIAAGIAGHSLAVCYRDFPARLACELWRHYCRSLSADEVYHVRTAADVRKLGQQTGEVRAVLVHAARLHNSIAWVLRLHVPDDEQTRPAVFTASPPADLDDDPGNTLVLQGNPGESKAIEDWLLGGVRSEPNWSNLQPLTDTEVEARLQAILRPNDTSGRVGRDRFRNLQVLRALLAGACLLRLSLGGHDSDNDAMITLDDYAMVCRLLQSPMVCTTDELCDPLAIAMVDRTNVYLTVKYGPDSVGRNPFYADDYDRYVHGLGGPPRRDLVTRREIADLGNTRSRMVRRLVEYICGQTEGYETFGRMGLCRRRPTRAEWRRLPADELVTRLRPWTPKQVRTRFDHLRQAGLITAEREHSNAPWCYGLPEELSTVRSPFRNLPSADELASGGPATSQ